MIAVVKVRTRCPVVTVPGGFVVRRVIVMRDMVRVRIMKRVSVRDIALSVSVPLAIRNP
jgi:hypothetical protein